MTDAMFADEARMRSRSNWLIYSDAGRLQVAPGAFLFEGRHTRMEATGIDGVSIERARVAWWPGLVMMAGAALFVAVVAALMSWSGAPSGLVWGTVGIAALAGLLAGMYSYNQQVWVRVVGIAPDGQRFVAYLRQDERRGGGLPRRKVTEALADQIRGIRT